MKIVLQHPATGEDFTIGLDEVRVTADMFREQARVFLDTATKLDRIAAAQPRKRVRRKKVEPQHDQGGVGGGHTIPQINTQTATTTNAPKSPARAKAEEALAETDRRLAEERARREAVPVEPRIDETEPAEDPIEQMEGVFGDDQ